MTHPQGHLLSLQMRVGVSLTCRYKLDIVFIILQLYLVKVRAILREAERKPIRTFASRLPFLPETRCLSSTSANVSLSWRDGHLPLVSNGRRYLISAGSFVTHPTEFHQKLSEMNEWPLQVKHDNKILNEDVHAKNPIRCGGYVPFFISLSNLRTFSPSGYGCSYGLVWMPWQRNRQPLGVLTKRGRSLGADSSTPMLHLFGLFIDPLKC